MNERITIPTINGQHEILASIETEHRLYKWVAAFSDGGMVTGCMLLQQPYVGVVVELGQVTITEDDCIDFQWRILDPGQCKYDLSIDNIVFTKYLERVVIDRLKEIGETSDVEEDIPRNSGSS